MIKKVFLSMIIAVLVIIIVIIAYFTLPWILIQIGMTLQPNPPRPEIRYGEFPFRLEYEINGQRKVIEDILICEYDGIGMNLGQGKYRKWNARFASGKGKILLLRVDDSKEIYYNPGSPAYYMGDYKNPERHRLNFRNAWYIEWDDERITRIGRVDEEELLEKYNIKIISWDYTEPIINKFE